MITVITTFVNGIVSQVSVNNKVRAPRQDDVTRQKAMECMNKAGYVFRSGSTNEMLYVKPENDIEKLEIALRDHDWTFSMSDDSQIFQRGVRQMKEIKTLCKAVGEKTARKMIKPYLTRRSGVVWIEDYLK